MFPATVSPASSAYPLLSQLVTRLAEGKPAAVQRRVWTRLAVVTVGLVLALGRHTLAQLLVAVGVGATDWTAWYRLFNRSRCDLDRLQTGLVRDVVGQGGPGAVLVAVLDATQVPRSSRRFPGVWWGRAPRTPGWQRGMHLVQRWEGLSLLVADAARGVSRAVPVWWEPIRAANSTPVGTVPVRSECATGLAGLRWLRHTLAVLGRATQPVLVLGDGGYGNAPMLNGLPPDWWLLARVARNRRLFALPAPGAGRGRPRRYGAPGPQAADTLTAPAPAWQPVPLPIRDRLRSAQVRVTGPWLLHGAPTHPVMLVTVRGKGKTATQHRVDAQVLVVTAVATAAGRWTLPLPVAALLGWYWQRWEVEVMHRELKSTFGLGDQQAWSPAAAARTVPWVVWTYGALVLTACEQWGLGPGPLPHLGCWWHPRRWSFATLWQAVRQECWQASDFQPIWTRSPDGWVEMERWTASMTNASLGIRHI